MTWVAVAVASLGCAGLKLAGHVMAGRADLRGAGRRVVEALPIALLAALVAVATLASGPRLVLDSRAAGVGAAILLVAARAPFLVVVVAACAVAALVHAL